MLLAAVTITLIRHALPDVSMYRNEIQGWASNYMDFPVVIHSIQADWQGWIPYLYLQNIDLLNKAGTTPIIHFENVHMSIDLISSLLNREIIPKKLMISGFKIAVARRENGSIAIEGINVKTSPSNKYNDNELAEWFFNQNEIEIRDAQIEWQDIQLIQDSMLLTDVNLILRSDDDRLQIGGSFTLPPFYGHDMEFALDIFGDPLTSIWSAELYLHGDNINPDNWYSNYRPTDLNIAGGEANITVWSTWANSRLINLEGQLGYSDFAILLSDTKINIENLVYRFSGARNTNEDWLFNIKLESLITQNGAWPETDLVFKFKPDLKNSGTYRFLVNFSYLKLDDLAPILMNLSNLPDSTRETILKHILGGNLHEGIVDYDPNRRPGDKLQYDLSFEQLNADISDDLPRLVDLSGHAYGSISEGVITFNNDNAEFYFPRIENNFRWLFGLNGKVSWSNDDNILEISTNLVHFKNLDIGIKVSGNVEVTHSSPSFVDTILEIETGDLEKNISYIPLRSDNRMKNWMQRSILGGELNSASLIFRGNPADFPFNDNSGQFKAIVNVSDTVLEYSRNWPIIDDIDAEIIFDGKVLTSILYDGRIFDSGIVSGMAKVSNLLEKEKTVSVNGHLNGQNSDLRNFITKSSLRNDALITKISDTLGNGQFELDLDLSIPINFPERKISVMGELHLADTTLKSNLPHLNLSGVSGSASFTNDTLTAIGLDAKLNNHNVNVDIVGSKSDEDIPAIVSIYGKSDNQFIVDQIIEYYPGAETIANSIMEKITGSTNWKASISYKKENEPNVFMRSLKINSDLYGLELNLPAPLNKHSNERVYFNIDKNLDFETDRTIKLKYESIISTALEMELHEKNTNGVSDLPGNQLPDDDKYDRILLSGTTDILSIDDWLEFISKEKINTDNSNDNINLDTDLFVKELIFTGRRFHNTSLQVTKHENSRHLTMGGDSVAGLITLPDSGHLLDSIIANLDYLYLEKIDSTDGKTLKPMDIPSINASINSFKYDDHDLGKMELLAISNDNSLILDRIHFEKPDLNIYATGIWIENPSGTDTSDFNINLRASEFNSMLETFGYNMNVITNGETSIIIDADWDGSPTDFALDKLNGNLNMQISKGQLLGVSSTAGRLFGLLSIQTLPRRLSLDFADLFSKGLAFDIIEGNFKIENGNAYTNDLILKGPSANVSITGRTGLSEHDYDQRATVTPQIADSLSVASALFGPVGIGLGAALYLAGSMFDTLRDNINSILVYQYTITGSWNDPVIEKFKPGEENDS